jgi:hypothetical protein
MTLTNPSGHPEKSSAIEAYDFNLDSSAQAGVTAPVSHQQQPNRSATNAIGLRQKTAASTNRIVLRSADRPSKSSKSPLLRRKQPFLKVQFNRARDRELATALSVAFGESHRRRRRLRYLQPLHCPKRDFALDQYREGQSY